MAWGDDFLGHQHAKLQQFASPNALSGKISKSCRLALDHAPNIIEWAVEDKFLGNSKIIEKYTRQFQVIRDTFQLLCPICNRTSPEAIDCWGKTRMELESQVLLRWSDSEQGEVCPKCGNAKLQFIEDGMLEPIDTMIGVAGMRSGKSVVAGVMATYIEHELCIIGDIHDYFEILPGDPLQMSFLATTLTQSKETIWAKYRAMRENARWFKKYVPWVKDLQAKQTGPEGMKRWKYDEEAEGEIYNGLIDLSCKSLNSNSAGLAGATRVAGFGDELSRFDTTESKRSASEVVKVLSQGLKTVRGARDRKKYRHWWGLFVAVSSPISIEDQTMVMVGQKIRGQYNWHYATWEFNPDLPRESFDADFERDPAGAARDFGASPPNAALPYIEDEARFRKATDFSIKPTVSFQKIEPVDKTERKYVGAMVAQVTYDPHHVHHLHFDAGASFDTFAGCSAHGEWLDVKDEKTGQTSRKFITVYDWLLGIQPIPGKTISEKRTVWFDCVVKILETIQKQQRIGSVTFDRWNSEYIIQQIRNLGITTENRSVTAADFLAFLRNANDGELKLLPPRIDEPKDARQKNDEEKAIYELLRLERSPDLKRIYNPRKGQVHGLNSDDLAQVVVGAHTNVQRSVVAISDSNSTKETLRRENAASAMYQQGGGGRIARSRAY